MRRIVNKINTPDLITLEEVLANDAQYIGYETEGGLRAYLTVRGGYHGFLYYENPAMPSTRPQNMLKFKSITRKRAIEEVIDKRELLQFDTLWEFTQWLSRGKNATVHNRLEDIMRYATCDELDDAMVIEIFGRDNPSQEKLNIARRIIDILNNG